MGEDVVDLVFGDPPYNVPIKGHGSGLGKIQHREFAQAMGDVAFESIRESCESHQKGRKRMVGFAAKMANAISEAPLDAARRRVIHDDITAEQYSLPGLPARSRRDQHNHPRSPCRDIQGQIAFSARVQEYVSWKIV